MRRIPQPDTKNPPLGEHQGLRGGDRGGNHSRPLEVCDDSITVGAEGADYKRTEYTAKNGQQRIKLTKRS